MSPAITGAAALTGSQLGPVVIWLCTVVHVVPPSADVAGVIGAALLSGGHWAATQISAWLANRKANAAPAPAPVAPPAQ